MQYLTPYLIKALIKIQTTYYKDNVVTFKDLEYPQLSDSGRL